MTKLEIHQHLMTFDQLVTKVRLVSLETKAVPAPVAIVEANPQTSYEERMVELEWTVNRLQVSPKCFNCGGQDMWRKIV